MRLHVVLTVVDSLSGTPLRADARRNRAALIAKAREVADAGAFMDLRLDDFAVLAGVGRATLYRHFPTRAALVQAVYSQDIAALAHRARDLQASLPGFEALSTFLRETLAHMQTHHGLPWALGTPPTPGCGATEGVGVLAQAVIDLVEAAVEDHSIREDADAGAVLIAVRGIGAAHDRPGWKTEAEGLLTLVLDGLRRPQRSPQP